MAQSRSKPGRHPVQAAELALSDPRSLDLRQLFELIHGVNPTTQHVGETERRHRYRLKADLQSLLVRRFPEALHVEAVPGQPGVVGLAHRSGQADACHAVLAELDDDARSWAQFYLDTAERAVLAAVVQRPAGVASPAPGRAPQVGLKSAMELAAAAMTAYDYEAACDAYRQALAASSGAVAVAVPLCELLVDTYGDDAAALALERQLDREALAHPRVRLLLAIAAARSGDGARMGRWLAGLEDPRCADALVHWARHCLTAGDLGEANRVITRGRREFPLGPWQPLVTDLQRQREQARAPHERDLQAALDAGDLDAVERQASALLANHDSALARKALSTVTEARKQASRGAAWSQAARHEAAGHLDLALGLLRQIHCEDPEFPGVSESIERLRLADQEARRRQSIGQVARAWQCGDKAAALAAWLDLDATARAEVTTAAPNEAWAWLDRLARGGQRPRDAVAATLALGTALASEADDPTGALAQLDMHEALRTLAVAGALRGRLQERLALQRKARLDTDLDRAEASHAVGDFGGLGRLLDEMRGRVATDAQQARRLVLQEVLREHDTRLGLVQRQWLAEQKADAIAALTAAEARRPAARDASELAQIENDVARLQVSVRAAWSMRWQRFDRPELPQLNVLHGAGKGRPHLGVDHRGRVVLVAVRGEVLLLELVDPTCGQVLVRACMRSPLLKHQARTQVCGHVLYVATMDAAWIEIDLERLLVTRSQSVDLPPGSHLDSLFVVPEAGLAWLNVRSGGTHAAIDQLVAVDLRSLRCQRRDADLGVDARAVVVAGAPLLLTRADDGGARLLAADGKPQPTLCNLPGGWTVRDLVGGPGPAMVALLTARAAPQPVLRLWSEASGHHDIGPLDAAVRPSLAASQIQGLVWTLHAEPSVAGLHLTAVRPGRQTWQRVHEVRVASDAHFVQAPDASQVWLVASQRGALQVQRLSATPPFAETPAAYVTPVAWTPGRRNISLRVDHQLRVNQLLSSPPARRVDAVAQLWRDVGSTDQKMALLVMLYHPALRPLIAELEARLGPEGDRDPALCMYRMEVTLNHEPPADLADRFAGVRTDGWTDYDTTHWLHLRAFVELLAGRPDTALALLAQTAKAALLGTSCTCPETVWHALAQDALGPVSSLGATLRLWRDEAKEAVALTRAVRAADLAWGRGDAGAAIAALDVPLVWHHKPTQAIARLAQAWLRLPPSPAEWFDASIALSACVQILGDGLPVNGLPVPGAMWSDPQIIAVIDEARAWLAAGKGAETLLT